MTPPDPCIDLAMANALAQESSPYLQQHADNPVDWLPWGEEAFRRARTLDRPVHLSIGYFACHWCHVMAHECFENPAIAAQLNADFVNIKVDRQERPDIDDLYQHVVRMMGASGGWPLTVFLTPQQEPFFAGTYFPPDDRQGRPGFPRLLRGIRHAWSARRDEILANCREFLRGFAHQDDATWRPHAASVPDPARAGALALARGIDHEHGGLVGGPKFPNPCAFDLLLRVGARTRDAVLLEAVAGALDAVVSGGLHDHVGGGFARYCVDESWTVPHFEKMLYDNALLVRLLADAWRLRPRPAWRAALEGACDYVRRDLCHPEGAFFSSEDADSEGEEGRFYVWTPAALHEVLGAADAVFAARAYGVVEGGNFEHGASVLQRRLALDAGEEARLEGIRVRLFAARARRPRPGRDENVLCGWNALMIQGLCAAWQAARRPQDLEAAQRALDFLRTHLVQPQGGGSALWRVWRDGRASVPGFLEDYAFLANACFDLYECRFDDAARQWGLALVDALLDRFWDDGLHFTPRDGDALVHRPRLAYDNAWPSGHSQGAFALLRAHALTGQPLYRERAQRIFEGFGAAADSNPFGFAHLLAARDFAAEGGPAIISFDAPAPDAELVRAVHGRYLPARVLCRAAPGAPRAALPAAQVCRDGTCLPPVTTPQELLLALGI